MVSELKAEFEVISESKYFDIKWFSEINGLTDLGSNEEVINFFLKNANKLRLDPSPDFDTDLYLRKYEDIRIAGINALYHYEAFGKAEGREADPVVNINQKNKQWLNDYFLIDNSGFFDEAFYLEVNSDVAANGIDPLLHFCKYGWMECRNPSRDFDLWQYRLKSMNVNESELNPLIHFINNGPENTDNKKNTVIPSYPNRRCILFAGYDIDGIVDDYVVDYVSELSKFGDVYYLADSGVNKKELSKLEPYVVSSWAVRHGKYDFGSYSMLANDLVGWDIIESYDELILANDSCYLLKPLNDVFTEMDSRKTDWWGMQATKGLSRTRETSSNIFDRPIPLQEVRENYLDEYEKDDFYDFHVGSYFLAFRKNVIHGGELKKLLSLVDKEKNKLLVIQKYEIGLTRLLIRSGYHFDCYISDLYPFHPVYSDNIYKLISSGYPFFKRYLLTENHYQVPDLFLWKEKVRAILPEANLGNAECNLNRVAERDKLTFNFSIKTTSNGAVEVPVLLSDTDLVERDKTTKKNANWWVFPVCAYDNNLSGNERSVFELIRNDNSIKKIILTRKKALSLTGENVVCVPLKSREGQEYLLRSMVVFIKHTAYRNTMSSLSAKGRYFINLWHGIPLKKIGCASLDMQSNLKALMKEHTKNHAVIASSHVDSLAMASAFYPLMLKDIWVTGLPRIDFILQSEALLPLDFQTELELLRSQLGGRKLLLFCPTFKNGQELSYYQFSENEVKQLDSWLKENNFVLGIREHMADSAQSYMSSLKDISTLNLSNRLYPNIEILYREASAIITDYSSCFIDFMVTGKPMLSFAYDLDTYMNEERGLFYDIHDAFAGPVCKDFNELMDNLEDLGKEKELMSAQDYANRQRLFFNYLDSDNAKRVVERVSKLS